MENSLIETVIHCSGKEQKSFEDYLYREIKPKYKQNLSFPGLKLPVEESTSLDCQKLRRSLFLLKQNGD